VCAPEFKNDDVLLRIQAGNTIGAIPLISPTTGKVDYGIIIKPRFQWDGIGAMLSQMGWRVAPMPLKLENFRGSERSIPPWLLSSIVLLRISNLLKVLGRRFEMITEDLSAPRGEVNWNEYASRSMVTGRFSSVPCRFPDLRRDKELVGTIRYCLERIIEGLQSQVEHGAFVHRLLDLARKLLLEVKDVPVFFPASTLLEAWTRRPLKSEAYSDGLLALVWTIEKRGLAGASKLEGIPWVMEMEAFFEAWLETLLNSVARTTAGLLKTGRQKQTIKPIGWDPPYLGSQKSLIPDLWLQWGSTTLVVDAKYKRHFEELQFRSWGSIEAEWKEQHRNDLLQVLAYANLAESRTIISCLIYPCTPSTWDYLKHSGRLFHKAIITVGDRALHLWMTAAPMKAAVDEVAAPIIRELMPVLRAAE
jgi:5-methylcytosine-specific restriction endonuclease McrBC regulatory subunit McrC